MLVTTQFCLFVLSNDFPVEFDGPKLNSFLMLQIQLKYLAEEMQAISKGLEKVVQELTASENDGLVSEIFCKVLKIRQLLTWINKYGCGWSSMSYWWRMGYLEACDKLKGFLPHVKLTLSVPVKHRSVSQKYRLAGADSWHVLLHR